MLSRSASRMWILRWWTLSGALPPTPSPKLQHHPCLQPSSLHSPHQRHLWIFHSRPQQAQIPLCRMQAPLRLSQTAACRQRMTAQRLHQQPSMSMVQLMHRPSLQGRLPPSELQNSLPALQPPPPHLAASQQKRLLRPGRCLQQLPPGFPGQCPSQQPAPQSPLQSVRQIVVRLLGWVVAEGHSPTRHPHLPGPCLPPRTPCGPVEVT